MSTAIQSPFAALTLHRDGWTNGFQLSIETEDGGGYRLAGPKFNGSSTVLLQHRLTQRDADELRRYLDHAFPSP